MNKWKIEIGFKNGLVKNGIYEGEEQDTSSIFKKLFLDEQNVINKITHENGGDLFYTLGDISFIIIKEFH